MKRALLLLLFLCLWTFEAWAQGKTVAGIVLDKTNEPIIGASIREIGTSNGVLSDAEGRFRLQLRGDKLSLTISSVGYESQTINLTGRDLSQPLRIQLKDESKLIDEVVVTAYGGRQLRSKMTNSRTKRWKKGSSLIPLRHSLVQSLGYVCNKHQVAPVQHLRLSSVEVQT